MNIPYAGPTEFPKVLDFIQQRAQQADISGDWPTFQLQALNAAGAMRWSVPEKFGGEELPALDLHLKYEQIATASLAVALILTQRDSAIGLITAAQGAPKRTTMLTRFAKNDNFPTVGIAQLTTSRQRGAPALAAQPAQGGYRLNGEIPWCTGAGLADFIVAGATLPNDQQILFLLQPHLSGITIARPMQLVALRSTCTTSLTLKNVLLEESWLLRGPEPKVLGPRPGSLILGQTFLATGLARSALDLIAAHHSDRAKSAFEKFEHQLQTLRNEIQSLSNPGQEEQATIQNPRLRGQCNDLALRITHTAVTLYKGTALQQSHPAQRLAREAMFLLVWSCPTPVIDCTVNLLSNGQ